MIRPTITFPNHSLNTDTTLSFDTFSGTFISFEILSIHNLYMNYSYAWKFENPNTPSGTSISSEILFDSPVVFWFAVLFLTGGRLRMKHLSLRHCQLLRKLMSSRGRCRVPSHLLSFSCGPGVVLFCLFVSFGWNFSITTLGWGFLVNGSDDVWGDFTTLA